MAESAMRVLVLMAAGMLMFGVAGCGGAAGNIEQKTSAPSPTSTLPPSATATTEPTATATAGVTGATCQPDPYGIYSTQTEFISNLDTAPLPAPPQTKHGIGSSGANGSVSQGGESGMCTIGTMATVTNFYTSQLPQLGWQYSAPPASLIPCFHGNVPAKAWWKGMDTFSWYDGGDAGGGSVFWSYTYCSVNG